MSKRRRKHIPPTGELRMSQLLTTFGPGSMVDLPNYAVLIGGLDHWQFAEKKRIYEERLEGRLRELLSLDELALYEPPTDNGDPTAPRSGVTASGRGSTGLSTMVCFLVFGGSILILTLTVASSSAPPRRMP